MPTPPEMLDTPRDRSLLKAVAMETARRLTGLSRISAAYRAFPRATGEPFLDTVARELGIECDMSPADVSHIPQTGPVVVVANHPFGAAEGIVLPRLLSQVRGDVRVLANHLLGGIPELRDSLILVDPFHPGTAAANVRGLREALRHLAAGGMLVTFPAGAVSHFRVERMAVTDQEWSSTIGRLVRRSRATVLPVYFPGANGPLFQLAGLLHPMLRTALLPHALLDRRQKRMQVHIGRPIAFDRLVHAGDDRTLSEHLRRRTYLLATRGTAAGPKTASMVRLAPAVEPARLQKDVEALPAGHVLGSSGELDVILASASLLPNVLEEIARLRELTFRSAGEGTGRALDLDPYDVSYEHLFLWNRERREIAGAYRLGIMETILSKHGVAGLYTSTLFRYSAAFVDAFGRNAVELGRSWIRPEYQRHYLPLLMLWKGIGTFAACNPQRCILFGPASISNEYTPGSRALLARYLSTAASAPEIRPHVTARAPFRAPRLPELPESIEGFEELQEMLLDLEGGQRDVPVLLRQYLNIGGRVAGLNVDKSFGNVLDALIFIDLRKSAPRTLRRYMGEEGAKAFGTYHARVVE